MDPATFEEYEERTSQNTEIVGHGLATATHVACPFCGAAGYAVWPVMSAQEAMSKDTTCTACGRSGRAVVERTESGIEVEFVQTAGEDPPAYLPRIRRIGRELNI